jgi:hypothetical protein
VLPVHHHHRASVHPRRICAMQLSG